MYKLSVCIYLNHVPYDLSQKSYEFKSSVNFGISEKKFKIPWGRTIFLKIMLKVNLHKYGYLSFLVQVS